MLCETCRRESPIVEHGPTLANVMQRYPKGITFADFEQLFCVADVAKMTLNL